MLTAAHDYDSLASVFTDLVKSFVGDILMPPISVILPLKHNIEEKFAVLRPGPFYNTTSGYNTLKQAQEDGAVVMAYGSFIYQVVTFMMIGLSLYSMAHMYTLLSEEPIIKRTKKCKYCRQRINDKVQLRRAAPCHQKTTLLIMGQALRCVNCTSWLDGREERVHY
jgi:large conductance mechanosensitive channel